MIDILKIMTRGSVIISLILSIFILVKVSDKKWCKNTGENYMKVKSTNACAYIGGPGYDDFPCEKWKKQDRKGEICTWGNGDTLDCSQGLECCNVICNKNKKGEFLYDYNDRKGMGHCIDNSP